MNGGARLAVYRVRLAVGLTRAAGVLQEPSTGGLI